MMATMPTPNLSVICNRGQDFVVSVRLLDKASRPLVLGSGADLTFLCSKIEGTPPFTGFDLRISTSTFSHDAATGFTRGVVAKANTSLVPAAILSSPFIIVLKDSLGQYSRLVEGTINFAKNWPVT